MLLRILGLLIGIFGLFVFGLILIAQGEFVTGVFGLITCILFLFYGITGKQCLGKWFQPLIKKKDDAENT